MKILAIKYILPRGLEPDMPDGSWKCEKCSNINYPFRTKCNRQNCGADKPAETNKSLPDSANANDQVYFVIFLPCMTLYLKIFVSSDPSNMCNKTKSIYTKKSCILRIHLCYYFSWLILKVLSCSLFCFIYILGLVINRVVYCSSEY